MNGGTPVSVVAEQARRGCASMRLDRPHLVGVASVTGRQPRRAAGLPPCTFTTWPVTPRRGRTRATPRPRPGSRARSGRTRLPSSSMKPPATASVRRVRATGAIAFDAHADALELARHHDRHRRDAGLGRRVVHLAGVAVEARLRRGVHDRRVDRLAGVLALLPPVRGGERGWCEVALEVDVDDRVPLRLVMLKLILSRRIPALLMSTSSPPSSSTACATSASPPVPGRRCRRSWRRPCRRRRRSRRRPAAPGAGRRPRRVASPPRSFTTTAAPSAASSSASARPMPRPAPVTIATLPSNRPMDPLRPRRLADVGRQTLSAGSEYVSDR